MLEQTLRLRQFSDRLRLIEQEVSSIRQELAELQKPTGNTMPVAMTQPPILFAWADKAALRQWSMNWYRSLPVQVLPLGVRRLQQQMAQTGLTQNEMSRSLIEAREE